MGDWCLVEEHIAVRGDFPTAFQKCHAALRNIRARLRTVDPQTGTLCGRVGPFLIWWCDEISVQVGPPRGHACPVLVRSRPCWPLIQFDFGRNQRHCRRFMEKIQEIETPGHVL